MKKKSCLREIQKRLPNGIVIHDETTFEFSEEEVISIFIWLKYFRAHFEKLGFTELPSIAIPTISRRLRLDFGVYNQPSNLPNEFGQNVVYLSSHGKLRKNTSFKEACRVLGI